ncbi:MAG: hypothetical protein WDZ90_02710 [Candidatus Paceibacterota bacterium]
MMIEELDMLDEILLEDEEAEDVETDAEKEEEGSWDDDEEE